MVRELTDNRDGTFAGMFLDPLKKNSLITCTSNGKILFWKTDSCVIVKKIPLKITSLSTVKNFILATIDDSLHGLVHYEDINNLSKIVLVELADGKVAHEYVLPTVTNNSKVKVKLSNGNGFMVVLHRNSLYVISKESNEFICHNTGIAANVVECHPEEQMIATGDFKGRIFLWHSIFSKTPGKVLLHWHHMIVLSLAFSQSGTVLYSGGAECVLVKWQIKEKTLGKNFLPRVAGSIKQIGVDTKRDKLTISIDDNSIQVINSNMDMLKTIQDFTIVSPYDSALIEPYPVGIRVNPKNRHLVMNGKIGHLQFFSTKSMRLLFNVDITLRNAMPRQEKRNNFSTEVTHTAFSSSGSWMATVENWNDKVHSAESRLKFWKFLNGKQTYLLHTQVEQAHEKSILSLEFPPSSATDSMICATAGLDRMIKIWSLEGSEEIENPKKIWMLIEQITYKNLPVKSMNFSQDSSLLTAGFGNSLCVWETTNFKLKCALSAPAFDGSTNRVVFSIANKKKSNGSQTTITSLIEKRRKLLKMMKGIIDEGDSTLVKNITQEKTRYFKKKSEEKLKAKELKTKEKQQIFRQVLANNNLNFNEKLQIFHKLNIYYKISSHMESEVTNFISRQAIEETQLYKGLHKGLNEMRNDEKYKILWRFKTWRLLDLKRNRKIVTIRKLMKQPINHNAIKNNEQSENGEKLLPVKNLAHITNVLFCADDLSHLVIVTTLNRILIWNLLTLKLQGSYKMHVKKITLDPMTNLVAAFTKYNELFVFQPSPTLNVFYQKNIPDIYDAIWVPRETPKTQSISVNWQAKSQLFILTSNQEICVLSNQDFDDDVIEVPCMDEINQFTSSTPFAAIMAKKKTSEKSRDLSIRRILTNSSGHVKEVRLFFR